jgi:CBS domain containing-hemolysin-like protein
MRGRAALLLGAGSVLATAETHVESSALGWYFAAAVLMILLNGLYVAYEFAILTAKRSTFGAPDVAGRRTSRAALASMSDLSMHLAGAQLGITATSLVLGYVGEPAFATVIEAGLGSLVSESVARGVGIVASLTIVVFLHLVVGEMVPKNIALAAPDAAMRWLVLPYRAYLAVVRPFVMALNGMANLGCRLIGVEPTDELVAVHSVSELAVIVTHSSEGGAIEADEAELLTGALAFAQRPVGEVAAALSDLTVLRLGATVAQAERVVMASGRERVPIGGTDPARPLIGYVHARDLLAVDPALRSAPIPTDLVRQMAIVRSDRSLVEVLRALRRVRRQLALVVENGEPIGIVSVEDVISALMTRSADSPAPSSVG